MFHARLILVLPFCALIGCTQFPQLDGTVAHDVEHAPYPELLPLEPILAKANTSAVNPAQEEASLQGRLGQLRARANRLRGSVLSGAEKLRLERGLR
jgi:hypothetical protein